MSIHQIVAPDVEKGIEIPTIMLADERATYSFLCISSGIHLPLPTQQTDITPAPFRDSFQLKIGLDRDGGALIRYLEIDPFSVEDPFHHRRNAPPRVFRWKEKTSFHLGRTSHELFPITSTEPGAHTSILYRIITSL